VIAKDSEESQLEQVNITDNDATSFPDGQFPKTARAGGLRSLKRDRGRGCMQGSQ